MRTLESDIDVIAVAREILKAGLNKAATDESRKRAAKDALDVLNQPLDGGGLSAQIMLLAKGHYPELKGMRRLDALAVVAATCCGLYVEHASENDMFEQVVHAFVFKVRNPFDSFDGLKRLFDPFCNKGEHVGYVSRDVMVDSILGKLSTISLRDVDFGSEKKLDVSEALARFKRIKDGWDPRDED